MSRRLHELVVLFRNLAGRSPAERLDLNRSLRRLAETLKPYAEEQGARLVLELDEDLPELFLSPKLVDQPILNLTINAIEQLRLAGSPTRRVHLRTSFHPERELPVQVTVADTGGGIHKVDQGRIFDLFFTTKNQGTGLGLYVSRLFAERLGGRLELVRGIRVRRQRVPPRAAAEVLAMIPIAGYPTRILVVDDNPHTCAALCSRLELQGGYAASAVENGLAALEILGRSPFDVVLCDLRLRGEMDGIAVTRELQRSWPETRVVVFTGFDDGAAKVAALNAGAFFFLSKPINFDELELAIDRINSVRRTERLHRYFEKLTRISYELQQSFDLDRVAQRIVQGACELGYQRARLYLYDAADQTLAGRAAAGMEIGPPFEGYLVPLHVQPVIRGLFHGDRPTFGTRTRCSSGTARNAPSPG